MRKYYFKKVSEQLLNIISLFVCVSVHYCCVALEKAKEVKRQQEEAIKELSHSSVRTTYTAQPLASHTHTHIHTRTHTHTYTHAHTHTRAHTHTHTHRSVLYKNI